MPFQPNSTPPSAPLPGMTPAPRARGLQVLLTIAAVIVIGAGIRATSGIITPILAAAFISMLAILPLGLLQGRLGVPRWIALLIVLVLTIGGALGLGYYLSRSAAALQPLLPAYQARLDELVLGALEALKSKGLSIDPQQAMDAMHSWKLSDFADVIVLQAARLLQDLVFVLLVSAFIIAEASSVPMKIKVAFPNAASNSALATVADKVKSFVVVVTELNIALAAINYAACIILDVPFAFLLSFLVFLLNYIPTIGAIAASVLVVAITLLTHGWGTAVAMAIVQAASGVFIGSVLQPRLLGARLGLSPLVVFLSLVVWGYLLGIAGMFFAVPLTIILKIVLDSTDDLRSLSVLLGDAASARDAARR